MSNTEPSSSSKEQTVSNSKKQKYIIIFLVILIIIATGIIVVLLNKKEEKESVSGGRGTVVTKENLDDVLNSLNEPVQDGYYCTSMSIDWHFDGTVSTDAYVANDVSNTRTVYFDLVLSDMQTILYSSPYIPVGAALEGVTLDTELEPGTYDTVVVYHLVDDNEQEVSNLSVGLTIYVK